MLVSVHFVTDDVTTVTPMKRGLKVRCRRRRRESYPTVTTVTPMKRGLKDDEWIYLNTGTYVTTVTPMKRGLKV